MGRSGRKFVTRDFDPYAGLETTTQSPRPSNDAPTYAECALNTGKLIILHFNLYLYMGPDKINPDQSSKHKLVLTLFMIVWKHLTNSGLSHWSRGQ